MKETAAVRITADICFFFTLMLMVVLSFQESLIPYVVVASLVLLSDTFAAKCENFLLRFVIALVPAAGLFFAGSTISMIVIGAALLYSVILMTAGLFGLENRIYRKLYYLMAVPTIGMMVIACTSKHNRPGVLVFGALFLILGIIALNEMRMGAAADRKWRLYNVLQILVPLSAVTAVLSILYGLLYLCGGLIEKILTPIAYLFYLLTSFLVKLGKGASDLTETVESTEVQETIEAIEETLEATQPTKEPYVPPPVLKLDWPMDKIGIALLILLGLYLVYRLIKANYHPEKREKEEYLFSSEAIRPEKKKKAERRSRGNAEKVRRIYRTYLKRLSKIGVVVTGDRTSEQVIELLRSKQEADYELRRIYVKARYGAAESVTDDDVRKAAQCLEELKK